MILENGIVRTMDATLPTARALAIAGARVAGGVGTHETALPSPEVVDLGGRCVLPGFTDSHVHFPTWSLSQHEVKLEGVTGLDEALERVRSHPRRGTWIRGTGWRSAEWDAQPTAAALDEVTGDAPALLWSRDYHSAWLNSAALVRAGGDLEVDGGVVERDAVDEPTGVLREESAWQFRARFAMPSEDEFVEATREGLHLAASRGVVAIHDKDGWLGAPGIFQRIADRMHRNGPPESGALADHGRELVTARDRDARAVEHPRGLRAERAVHEALQVADPQEAVADSRVDAERLELRKPLVRNRLPYAEREPVAIGDPLEDARRAQPTVLVVDRDDAAARREV